jgi:hypothetical protein
MLYKYTLLEICKVIYLKSHLHPSPCKWMELQLFEYIMLIIITMGHFYNSTAQNAQNKPMPIIERGLVDRISLD